LEFYLEKAEKRGVLRSNIELTKEELLSKIIFEPIIFIIRELMKPMIFAKNSMRKILLSYYL